MEMEMTITLGNVITMAMAATAIAVAWGKMQSELKAMRDSRKECLKRFEVIESDTYNSVQKLNDKMDALTATVHELVGEFRMFLKYEKRD